MTVHDKCTLKAAVFALTLTLLLTACGKAATPPTPTPEPPTPAQQTYDEETIARGQSLFGIFCVACHGPDAKGLPGLGLDLTTSAFVKSSDDAELLKFVLQGRGIDNPENTTGVAMPPRGGFPNLGDEQISQIIAYVRSLEE